MSPKPLKSSESGDFENVPMGWQSAVVCDVFDLGEVWSQYYGKSHYKVEISFWTGLWKSDDDSIPLIVTQRYTLSAHEKANLRKHLEQWRGRRFASEDECAAVELDNLIGKNLSIMVTHSDGKDGAVFANVDAMGPASGTKLAVPDGFVRKQDRVERPETRRGNGPGVGARPEPPRRPAPAPSTEPEGDPFDSLPSDNDDDDFDLPF